MIGGVGLGLGLTSRLGLAWVEVLEWCMVVGGVAGPCMDGGAWGLHRDGVLAVEMHARSSWTQEHRSGLTFNIINCGCDL